MNLIPMMRLLSESAFLFTLLWLFPLELRSGLLFGGAAICGVGCSLAGAAGEKTVLRCLCALVPLAALALPASVAERVCLALPAAYSLLLIFTNRVFADSWIYARHVKFSLIFELLLMIIGCSIRQERTYLFLLCGNVYLICGVYYLHQLRLGSGGSLGGRLRDLAWVCAVPAAAGTVTALIFGGVKPISKLVMAIVTGFGMAMEPVVDFLTRIDWVPDVDPVKVTFPPATTSATEFVETLPENTGAEAIREMTISPAVVRAMILAAVLAAIGLLLYAIYRFRRRPLTGRGEARWVEAAETVAEEEVLPTRRAGSNRKKVRKLYSTYLHLMQSRGLFRRSGDTTREIWESAKPYSDPEASGRLRQIYIRARYHTAAPVTDDDVRDAAEIMRQIRKKQ